MGAWKGIYTFVYYTSREDNEKNGTKRFSLSNHHSFIQQIVLILGSRLWCYTP